VENGHCWIFVPYHGNKVYMRAVEKTLSFEITTVPAEDFKEERSHSAPPKMSLTRIELDKIKEDILKAHT